MRWCEGYPVFTSPAESQKVCTSSEPTSDCPIASSSKKIALIAPFSWFFGTTAAGLGLARWRQCRRKQHP